MLIAIILKSLSIIVDLAALGFIVSSSIGDVLSRKKTKCFEIGIILFATAQLLFIASYAFHG